MSKIIRVNVAGQIWVRADNIDDAADYVRDALDDGFANLNDFRTIYMDDDVIVGECEVEEDEEDL